MWGFSRTKKSKDFIIRAMQGRFPKWKFEEEHFIIKRDNYGIQVDFKKMGRLTQVELSQWIEMSSFMCAPGIYLMIIGDRTEELEKEILEFLRKYEERSGNKK